MKYLLTMLLLMLPSLGQAALEDWHPTNQKLFKSYVVLNVVDVFQTFDMIDCQSNRGKQCPYLERNRIVGTHPNKTEIVLLKALTVGIAYYALDKDWDSSGWDNSNKPKFIALAVMNMIYIDTISHNHSIGLRVNFNF
jgi:hypothetical protein